jgi:hypothetical protein
MALTLSPGVGDVIAVPITRFAAVSATTADIATQVAPCKGRVVGISARTEAIGGTTVPTDVDIMVEKGTTDILASAIAVVDSSTPQTPAMGTLTTTLADLEVADGDVFHVDATVTGGSSPTCTGIEVIVYLARQ